jgi:hypothetical protein
MHTSISTFIRYQKLFAYGNWSVLLSLTKLVSLIIIDRIHPLCRRNFIFRIETIFPILMHNIETIIHILYLKEEEWIQ